MAVLTLERLLASMGFGSRKDARGLVRMGLVELDGKVLDDPFMEFKERPEFITVSILSISFSFSSSFAAAASPVKR